MSRKPESRAQFSATLRRRSFLAFSVVAGVWQLVGQRSSAAKQGTIDDYASALLAPFNASSAASIGQVVLAAHPQIGDAQKLITLLFASLELDSGSIERTRPRSIKLRFAHAVRQDFARGRVVNVSGWRLAQSEARLYALATQQIRQIDRS